MADQKRPRLLSLDGGGARGWTQLVILKQIIKLLIQELQQNTDSMEDLQDDNIYPCLFFDLIVGSGTGGINAIMIGRLGMSIKQCDDAWQKLRETLKVQKSSKELLDSKALETWAKELVAEYTGNEDTPMLVPAVKAQEATEGSEAVEAVPINPNRNGNRGCKVAVTTMRAQNIGMATCFRTYRVRANQEYNCAIWEAIRATTASALLYKPILIGRSWSKQEFINAELGANNPISHLLDEKTRIWLRQGNWPPPDPGCIVSIGSGKGKLISMPVETKENKVISTVMRLAWTNEPSPTEAHEKKLYDMMLDIAKDCERKHQEIKNSYQKDEEQVYFRFNIEHGMQGTEEGDYRESTSLSMQASAEDYINHAEYEVDFENVVNKLRQLTDTLPEIKPEETGVPPPYSEKATFSGYSNR